MNWIIPFTPCQTSRGICYDPLFPFLDLIQNCTKSISTSICVEDERGFKVCIGKDWGFCAEPLQSSKGLLLFRSSMYLELYLLAGCPLQVLKQLIEGLSYFRKVWNKPSIIANKPQEGPNLCHSGGLRPFCDRFNFVRASCNPLIANYMPQVFDFFFK